MKIMHFVSGLKSGGVEQMLTNYTEYINKYNDIKEYIIYQHVPNRVSLNKLINADNTCIRIHSKARYPLQNFLDTYQLIKKYKPDIIHAHMNLLNFIPLFIGFICGIKIRISHSHISHININSKIAEHLFKLFNKIFANKLLACGQRAGKYMYGRHNFFIIPNCVDIDQFNFNNKSRNKIRKKLNIKDNEILLGNIGRLTKQKNQIFLLNILKELLKISDKYKLIIIGNGEDKDKIIQKANEYKINNNFILHEPIKNVSEYYDAMDIFLLPSLYEGFPMSSIETQASGLNTIISDNIDKKAKLISSTKLLSINNINVWINCIINIKNNNRYINKHKFDTYDILYNYKILYELYKELLYEKYFISKSKK